MFIECSAKKGGEEIVGEEGLFERIVDKVSSVRSDWIRSVTLVSVESRRRDCRTRRRESIRAIFIDDSLLKQVIDTPQLYQKSLMTGIGRSTSATPPGTYPRKNINLDDEMAGNAGWCSC